MKRWRVAISIALLVVIALHWFASGRSARADRGEASLHGQVQFGTVKVGMRDAPGQADSVPFLSAGAQTTYATSNWYAYEAALWVGHLANPAWYTFDTMRGAERWGWPMTWMRAELGIMARFGVRLIPTLHAALGVQIRFAGQGSIAEHTYVDKPYGKPDLLPGWLTSELVGTLGAGMDYRLDDHWIAGMAVTAQRAVLAETPFQAIAATFHIRYYFYPEGAGL